jgi:Ca2+-binding EF-hand superfamily protein
MMINKTQAMIAGAALVVVLGAVAVAFAADWGQSTKKTRAASAGAPSSAMRLVQFDTDKDGRITRAEVDAGITAQFDAADTSSDGKLDAAEILRYNDKRKAERRARYEAWRAKAAAQGIDPGRPPSDRDTLDTLRVADWNLDGFITADEFGGKLRALAMRADRDGDGTIVADELKKRIRRKDEPTTPAASAAAQ